MSTLEIFTDGACRGNPGPAGIGVVIFDENGQVVKNISQAIGQATNNLAEYTALIYALQGALVLKASRVRIHTDSELLYRQLKGEYKIKNEKLKTLFDQVQHLKQRFAGFEMKLIPREENQEADRLATKAVAKIDTKPLTRNSPSPWGGVID